MLSLHGKIMLPEQYPRKEGLKLNKYELAKELTIAAITSNVINASADDHTTSKSMNVSIASNIATFYNTLVEQIKVENT